MPDLSDTIEQVAGEPAKAEGDQGAATNQPLPDLIAADQYLKAGTGLAGANAAGGPKSAWRTVRMARAIPPGATPPQPPPGASA